MDSERNIENTQSFKFGWLILLAKSVPGISKIDSISFSYYANRVSAAKKLGKSKIQISQAIGINRSNLDGKLAIPPSNLFRRSIILQLNSSKLYPPHDNWIRKIVFMFLIEECNESCHEKTGMDFCSGCNQRLYDSTAFGIYWHHRYTNNPFTDNEEKLWCKKATADTAEELRKRIGAVNYNEKQIENSINAVNNRLADVTHRLRIIIGKLMVDEEEKPKHRYLKDAIA